LPLARCKYRTILASYKPEKMGSEYWPLVLLLGAGMAYSIAAGKLTVLAALTGAAIGFVVFKGGGYAGILMMTCFFILGSAATGWKHQYKKGLGLAEVDKGRRNAGQVLANAGMAAITGLLAWKYPADAALYKLMMAAAFASAAADTLSSELGNVYGRKFYHILSFKKDQRGLNGVVSLEGTLFGIAGSLIIATIYALGNGWCQNFMWIVIAGTIGNYTDSVLGATLERRGSLNNDWVNFLNTLIAALVAWLFASA